jgi:hypothetical protein
MSQNQSVFQIRDWVEFDRNGRANCPCCNQGLHRGHNDKSLSLIPNTEFGYKCFRGCTPEEIRESLGAPPPRRNHSQHQELRSPEGNSKSKQPPSRSDFQVNQDFVNQSVALLLNETSPEVVATRQWLEGRGITSQAIEQFQIGYGTKRHTDPQTQTPTYYSCIVLFIPVPNSPGQYYQKKRLAPSLEGSHRPKTLAKWSQFGLPTTIWFTYLPENPQATWFCEGEWDAIRLGLIAQQQQAPVAIATSTSGCQTVPPPQELQRLPGDVIIFYDRNDQADSKGKQPGVEGAQKVALALGQRGKIALVPMPQDCQVKGWDVSNALDFGYSWSDFQAAAAAAQKPKVPTPSPTAHKEARQVRELILELLGQHLSQGQLTEAFNQLALATGWSVKEIKLLAHQIEQELEISETTSERLSELHTLETFKQQELDLSHFLPPHLATPLMRFAHWLQIPAAALLTGLLPTVASCLAPATRIIVKESIGFIEPPIIYAGIATESGQRKSPIFNALIDGLKQLQLAEDQRFQQDNAEYQREYQLWQAEKKSCGDLAQWLDSEPTPPKPLREYFVDKVTQESLDQIKAKQPNYGILWVKDELTGLFHGFNAYRGGRGEDKENFLSSWNGRGIKKNLKSGERICLPHDSLSIFGAIQDSVLQKKMGDFEDEQGEWARFLWCLIPLKAMRLPDDDRKYVLDFLAPLYQKAADLNPQHYRFSPQAQRLYQEYHAQLERRRVQHPQKGMRAVLAKMEGYCARLALILHLIDQLGHDLIPNNLIPPERVQAAIALTEFYISQVVLIHNYGAASLDDGSLTYRLSAILDKLNQFGELSARTLKMNTSWLRNVSSAKIRSYLLELAQLGYGTLVGAGRHLKLILNAVKLPQSPQPQLEIETVITSQAHSPTASVASVASVAVATGEAIETEVGTIVFEPEAQVILTQLEQIESGVLIQQLENAPQSAISRLCEQFEQEANRFWTVFEQSVHNWSERVANGLVKLYELLSPPPTNLELKALLLACETLTQLQALTKDYGQTAIKRVYQDCTQEQQLGIDALEACLIDAPVFKYIGQEILSNREHFCLFPGCLVYLDPNSHRSSSLAQVWLLDGIQQGQRLPVSVNQLWLQPIHKSPLTDP